MHIDLKHEQQLCVRAVRARAGVSFFVSVCLFDCLFVVVVGFFCFCFCFDTRWALDNTLATLPYMYLAEIKSPFNWRRVLWSPEIGFEMILSIITIPVANWNQRTPVWLGHLLHVGGGWSRSFWQLVRHLQQLCFLRASAATCWREGQGFHSNHAEIFYVEFLINLWHLNNSKLLLFTKSVRQTNTWRNQQTKKREQKQLRNNTEAILLSRQKVNNAIVIL